MSGEANRSRGGLGLWTLVAMVLGNAIGAGIYTTSGFSLADLGARQLTESGGEYLYVELHPKLTRIPRGATLDANQHSRGRWVVGHEGGGASWLICYPDLELAVIALSNMSGARADSLPYDVAREAMAEGLLRSD